MKRFSLVILLVIIMFPLVPSAHAARVRVVHRKTTRVHVVVRPGFPIRRTLPNVVVRPGVTVRVAPRVYLAPVVFTSTTLAVVPAGDQSWKGEESLDRDDDWTDFTMDIDQRGTKLLMQVEEGPARVSFAEVVFENGETQVVDFNDQVLTRGTYMLTDFRSGRKVDHVRFVAKATGDSTKIVARLMTAA